jgi:uncharacterized membrane protein
LFGYGYHCYCCCSSFRSTTPLGKPSWLYYFVVVVVIILLLLLFIFQVHNTSRKAKLAYVNEVDKPPRCFVMTIIVIIIVIVIVFLFIFQVHNTSRKAKLAYVDEVAKPPRDIQRAQTKNGTGLIAAPTAREVVRQMGGPPRPRGEGRGPRGEGGPSFGGFKTKAKVPPMMAKTMKMMKGMKNFRR